MIRCTAANCQYCNHLQNSHYTILVTVCARPSKGRQITNVAAIPIQGAVIDDNLSSHAGEHFGAAVPQTKCGLSPRYVQLMTITGGIGVGLFVGVGGVVSQAGLLPLAVGYIIYGVGFIWPTTLNVAEMVAWLPIRGSIYELAARFVDPALGFAMGWAYFSAGAMLVFTGYSAVATVISYWNINVNPAVWIAIAISVCYFLNMVAVKSVLSGILETMRGY